MDTVYSLEVFANALTGRMRLLREKFDHKGRG